jgi:hypothetical protein
VLVILSIAFCVVMRNRAQARSAQLHQMAVMQSQGQYGNNIDQGQYGNNVGNNPNNPVLPCSNPLSLCLLLWQACHGSWHTCMSDADIVFDKHYQGGSYGQPYGQPYGPQYGQQQQQGGMGTGTALALGVGGGLLGGWALSSAMDGGGYGGYGDGGGGGDMAGDVGM